MNIKPLQAFKHYYDLDSLAKRIYFLFEDAETSELLPLAEALVSETTKFLDEAKLDWNCCGNLGRHLTFLVRNLKKGLKQSCSQDIRDIIFFDLPQLFNKLLSLPEEHEDFDPAIKTSIFPLLDGGHYDSAIRKVFVLLTDRIRRKFNVTEQLDGEDLINRIFGGKSTVQMNIDENIKQSLRNLLSGFYGIFRNKFAHNAIDPKQSEVKAVLEMANAILLEIELIEIPENL